MTNKEAKEKLYMEWQKFLENNIDYAGISEAYKMAFKALEQEPKTEKIIKMRDATPEKRESVDAYIKSISKPTGIEFDEEPSDDLISRQVVLDLCDKSTKYDIPFEYYEGKKHIRGWDMGRIINMTKLMQLPSVKPQPKTGHWIAIDEEPHEVWECDHCGFVIDGSGCIDPYDYLDTYKFCPNCGIKMVESQESEE